MSHLAVAGALDYGPVLRLRRGLPPVLHHLVTHAAAPREFNGADLVDEILESAHAAECATEESCMQLLSVSAPLNHGYKENRYGCCMGEQEKKRRGDRLRERRLSVELSLEKAAAALHINSWQTIQNWEKGKGFPKRERMADVVRLYKTSREYLEDGTGQAHVERGPAALSVPDHLQKARQEFESQILKFFWGMSDKRVQRPLSHRIGYLCLR